MVTFPPLAPSCKWMADFLNSLVDGKSETEAIISANLKIATTKDFGRFKIRNFKDEPITLSLAVAGGGKQLKDIRRLSQLNLSEHGDWRKIHLGALEACLGRNPYFRDIETRLYNVYNNRVIDSLNSFNSAIFQELKSFLMGNLQNKDLQGLKAGIIMERGSEIAEHIDYSDSLIQALSEFGRETIIGIWAIGNKDHS